MGCVTVVTFEHTESCDALIFLFHLAKYAICIINVGDKYHCTARNTLSRLERCGMLWWQQLWGNIFDTFTTNVLHEIRCDDKLEFHISSL